MIIKVCVCLNLVLVKSARLTFSETEIFCSSAEQIQHEQWQWNLFPHCRDIAPFPDLEGSSLG